MASGFKWNPGGLRRFEREMGAKVERMDRALRAEWAGKPVGEVEVAARAALDRVGIRNLNAAKVTEYATAVSEGKPFKFVFG